MCKRWKERSSNHLENLFKEGSQYFENISKIIKVPLLLGNQTVQDGYKLHYECKENEVAEENVEILIFKK